MVALPPEDGLTLLELTQELLSRARLGCKQAGRAHRKSRSVHQKDE
jgi:hypothetical protein